MAWRIRRWRARGSHVPPAAGRRTGKSDVSVIGLYLLAAGGIRFAIEFLRINPRVVGNLSVAHVAALIAVGTGIVVMVVSGYRRP